jgi:hypothetical protein
MRISVRDCDYLAAVLPGLADRIWRVKWTDPIATLAILPVIVWEGREDLRLFPVSPPLRHPA